MKNISILENLEFLQDILSFLISKFNPLAIHNIGKYFALKKAHFLRSIDNVSGDYLEFGVYRGGSLAHSIRCHQSTLKFNQNLRTRFYGFDSFLGFGDLENKDHHFFYKDINFLSSIDIVKKRVYKSINKANKNNIDYVHLISGFFEETLPKGPNYYNIKKAAIIFIDCDTLGSSKFVFDFIFEILQPGTILLLDDFYSYNGSRQKGIAGSFYNFLSKRSVLVRYISSYGYGGTIYIVESIN
jgi:hypothetical protein